MRESAIARAFELLREPDDGRPVYLDRATFGYFAINETTTRQRADILELFDMPIMLHDLEAAGVNQKIRIIGRVETSIVAALKTPNTRAAAIKALNGDEFVYVAVFDRDFQIIEQWIISRHTIVMPKNCERLFVSEGSKTLCGVDISGVVFEEGTTTASMFNVANPVYEQGVNTLVRTTSEWSCSGNELTCIKIYDSDLSGIVDMNRMFATCGALEIVKLCSNKQISATQKKKINVEYMFVDSVGHLKDVEINFLEPDMIKTTTGPMFVWHKDRTIGDVRDIIHTSASMREYIEYEYSDTTHYSYPSYKVREYDNTADDMIKLIYSTQPHYKFKEIVKYEIEELKLAWIAYMMETTVAKEQWLTIYKNTNKIFLELINTSETTPYNKHDKMLRLPRTCLPVQEEGALCIEKSHIIGSKIRLNDIDDFADEPWEIGGALYEAFSTMYRRHAEGELSERSSGWVPSPARVNIAATSIRKRVAERLYREEENSKTQVTLERLKEVLEDDWIEHGIPSIASEGIIHRGDVGNHAIECRYDPVRYGIVGTQAEEFLPASCLSWSNAYEQWKELLFNGDVKDCGPLSLKALAYKLCRSAEELDPEYYAAELSGCKIEDTRLVKDLDPEYYATVLSGWKIDDIRLAKELMIKYTKSIAKAVIRLLDYMDAATASANKLIESFVLGKVKEMCGDDGIVWYNEQDTRSSQSSQSVQSTQHVEGVPVQKCKVCYGIIRNDRCESCGRRIF